MAKAYYDFVLLLGLFGILWLPDPAWLCAELWHQVVCCCMGLSHADATRLPLISSFPLPGCVQSSGTKWNTAIETQLCYEIKTFLLAGHETSAAMLMWSVYELGENSQARQKVSCCCVAAMLIVIPSGAHTPPTGHTQLSGVTATANCDGVAVAL
jgi:hypothetical protein